MSHVHFSSSDDDDDDDDYDSDDMVDERDKIHDPYDPFSPWGCFIRAMLYPVHPENSFMKIKVTFV